MISRFAVIRTVISLSEQDKAWLDRVAARQGVAMTEVVRRAVALLRERLEAEEPPLEQLLAETSGTWTGGDGLEHQQRLRDEW
jgi:site-specific recombinase